jgi:G8 domain
MRFSTVVPWLLLLAGSIGAQIRGDSTFLRQDTLLNVTFTGTVGSDQDVETEKLLMQHLEIEHPLDVGVDSTRRLAGAPQMFEPLFCNRIRCSAGSTTWKLANFNLNEKVTIPCGMCVVMDYTASSVLELPHGLNIEGSLRFPNGYSITIKTPFVHVQGVLEMSALRKVTDKPDIKILLTGTNELVTSFIPADNNKFKCSADGASIPSPCFVGRKAFVIAGGMVTIRGVPTGCATWTNLQDIASAGLPSPTEFTKLPTPNPACRSVGPYVQDDFETSLNPYGWTGGYGALFNISGGSFRVWDRKDANEHAPTLDMRKIRDCLVPDQDYLFRARIKMTKPGIATGTLTTCANLNINCLSLQSTVRTRTGVIGRRKGAELPSNAFRYGVWQDFYATVTYAQDELNWNNTFQILQLRGPEPQVEIEMDDVLFSLPPPAAVPNPTNVCGGNIVLNGNAELDSIHPYPINNNGGALTVEESGGNKYFHHYARTSDNDSIYYTMDAIGCLVAGGKYTVSARIRINSSSPVPTRINLRSTFANGTVVQRAIADCSTNSSWSVCETTFTLLPELTGVGVREMRLLFSTVAAPNRDMDIDDMELILMDGFIRTIIVPDNGISSCWNTGAEILITSHTLNYDDGQVRRIVSSPTQHGNGFVKLELDSAIVPPTTLNQSKDFAVEVALLSRNILFEGDTDEADSFLGAHFIVLHTPASTASQYIEGIEFRNFGQQGVLGKYVSCLSTLRSCDASVIGELTPLLVLPCSLFISTCATMPRDPS